MLFLGTVLRWQADSWKRVRGTSTQYLLNTNRIDSVRNVDNRCSLYYFDNPFDDRDSGHWMVISMTPANLIIQMDTALTNNSMTISVYPNNDRTEATADQTIGVAYFAYAVADVNDATKSWVTYATAGWDIKTVLVNHTLAALLAMV